jgi:hypothetical protein
MEHLGISRIDASFGVSKYPKELRETYLMENPVKEYVESKYHF